MQRKKLGTAVIWMVCLLGMVAVVWSRPPIGGAAPKGHPSLALTDPEPLPAANPLSTDDIVYSNSNAVPSRLVQPQPSPVAINPRLLPDGAWVRELKPYKVGFKFQSQRLFIELKAPTDLGPVKMELAADYQVTRDAILYGVITSAKVDFHHTADLLEVQTTSDRIARTLIDQPFAMRYRVDEDALTIKDFKMSQLLEDEEETWRQLVQFVISRYQRAEPIEDQP